MAKIAIVAALGGALTGCANVGTNPHDTGGAGITWYENHSARKADASGTGSSATAFGSGAVPGSGAKDEPGNVDSPTGSNGGQGRQANPNALL
jgi:hypothetical protein